MNVVYASNENYVRHMAASMVSLFAKNRKVPKLCVYVLSMGITGESRKRLEEMANGYKRRIRWVELRDIRERFDFGVDTRGFDISAMGRLFVGSLLPEHVKKVLYLDCDTVVGASLEDLWNTDLRGRALGAVMEPTIYESVKREIGFGKEDAYVNSGVLLIDLKKWREQAVEKKLLEFYEKKNGSLFACDQDTINGGLKGQIYFLSPRYNFFTNYRYFSYRELVKYSRTYRAVGEGEFLEAKGHPAIIHYAGDERPWIRGNLNHYRRAYEKALALTPWAGAEKEKGRELYMLAYHLMDYLTVACPPARRMISRGFGMKAVEARGRGGENRVGSGCEENRVGSRREETRGGKEEITGTEEYKKPRIEVLLAAFDGASYIEEQLNSILNQTIADIRILVSDDGSRDGTRGILERYEKQYPGRVVCVYRPKEGKYQNRGKRIPAPAMNFFWLMSQAKGDYVLLSDQDDAWLPEKVEKLLKRMKEIETTDIPALVFSDMEVADARLKPISPSFFAYSRCNPKRLSLSELLVENPVTGGALMMNRPLTELASRIPQACFMHDWWIALCASCFGEIDCVKEPLSRYRQHESNTLGAKRTGSLKDLQERCHRKRQVEENYHRMLWQAASFGKMYGERLTPRERQIIRAFLDLPDKTPAGRLAVIIKYGFYKSSRLMTLAQCVTIPPRRGKENQ